MQTKAEVIQSEFNKRGILLKESVTEAKSHVFQEGITNQFLTVNDLSGKRYLIRINGKLWPPFTREGEHHNLEQLHKKGFDTALVANKPQEGFQICDLQDEATSFTQIHAKGHRLSAIQAVAKTIQQYHQLAHFESHYSFQQTLGSASRRLRNSGNIEMIAIYRVVVSIFSLITQDNNEFVASHNDLLPSSIYFNGKKIVIVDWEYSGKNHRSYDLALFSLKSFLSPFEEAQLIKSYDPENDNRMEYWLPLMKAGVNFLLLLWQLNSSRDEGVHNALLLFKSLQSNLQEALMQQSAKSLFTEKRCLFFKPERKEAKKHALTNGNQENTGLDNDGLVSLASSL
ncbi:choline kinase [Legionella rubrilucens]|uniref:Choline kinase n=1 Tax=Legionella rubrilucens TaxID=458 RepID=A0A0W0XW06_9GAMM|nr:phosphotransferase [Legionella rubrilucens]KTD48626.1 choline kinase [Legionella rubrilucens]